MDNKSSGVLVKLEETAISDSHRWFPECDNLGLPFWMLCLTGEVGELANELKKVMRGTANFNDAKVKYKIDMEVADIFTYLLQIAGMLQIDLEAAYNVKRQFNEERFGPGPNGDAGAAGRAAQRLIRPGNTKPPREGR
jgi:NTP pyrophosphatase (non-canonical NTP hydrolase)